MEFPVCTSCNCLHLVMFSHTDPVRYMKILINQFSSVTQSCMTLWDLMDCTTPGLLVHHQLQELAQTYVHQIGNVVQPSHPLSSPSPPVFNLSQYQCLFQWINSSYQVAKVLQVQLQHQSFQWIFRTDLRNKGLPNLKNLAWFKLLSDVLLIILNESLSWLWCLWANIEISWKSC